MQSPMLNRLRELIIQGANDTNTDDDRELIQKEIDEIIEGIDDIVHNTEFNTIKPFIPPSEIVPGTAATSGKADIIFIIDNTGSMGAQIQNVRNNICNFVSALKAHNIIKSRITTTRHGHGQRNDKITERPSALTILSINDGTD